MQFQPRRAASIAAMSIFVICIIASNARLAAAGSGSVIAFVRTIGVICQDNPHLSLHQPQALSWLERKAVHKGDGRRAESSSFATYCNGSRLGMGVKGHQAVRPMSGSRCRSTQHLRHLVTAPSHRSCDLRLKATRGVTIAVVSSRERKRRQPGLATDDPAFVGWHQLVRGIQGSQIHFDLVGGASEKDEPQRGQKNRPA